MGVATLPRFTHDDEPLYIGHCSPVHAALLAHAAQATADSWSVTAVANITGRPRIDLRFGHAVFLLTPDQALEQLRVLNTEVVRHEEQAFELACAVAGRMTAAFETLARASD